MSSTVTGRCVGHYFQHGRGSPITADLVEDDGRVNGFMSDGEPDHSKPLADAVREAGLPGDAAKGTEEALRQFGTDGPIRVVSRLPTHSVLGGTRAGDRVYFLKSYQGVTVSGYQVGDRLLAHQDADHRVHYEGDLVGDTLEGRWWIEPNERTGSPGAEGTFRLVRDGTTAAKKRPWWKWW